ncbi:hypothetical protein GT204_06865 [Streptomyces sp. SID4919]|uniref:pentapeptide repeat-containing protein n=1 Tax=unclassified Streptomyces TaxID=2593676 RepID=UPI000823B274|nr:MULTISPECIES: pentapeptide repeat-containing protein [unclassified Streptomyces]MYY08633.1 hypothetical protein [Streptomyces sp. SID4919]SCK55552.1 Pentapeptide repeat-containing protein [Streptomyces sp. AmelKG-E11A]
MSPTLPSPARPRWPYCGDGVSGGDRAGCIGRSKDPHAACLAHLTDRDRDTHLAGLAPGDDIDYRGTTFTAHLLDRLLGALTGPVTQQPRFGAAQFGSAVFAGPARFGSATFTGDAQFNSATFHSDALFGSATFTGDAWFSSATFADDARFGSAVFTGPARFGSAVFTGDAQFDSARFHSDAWFGSAVFTGPARFGSAVFTGDAQFGSATFSGPVQYDSATFTGDAWFSLAMFTGDARFGSATFHSDARFRSAVFGRAVSFRSAVFERADELGPFVCAGTVVLSGARFNGPVTVSIAARRAACVRTRWVSTAALRLRHAEVDFTHAVFEYPLSIAAEQEPFSDEDGPLCEDRLACTPGPRVRMMSLHGVDAAHLVLADLDLTRCLFTGTIHLDQIRLEGDCAFATVPQRRRLRPWRFTQRRTLAEEHHWRSRRPHPAPDWHQAPATTTRTGPAQLAPVYRALRKAFEDSKNEPDAADFYFGEMEMRRHDGARPRAERTLLTAYWALSGYGLRAARAALWLVAAMTATLFSMMLWGLPADHWKPETTAVISGGQVRLPAEKPDPVNPGNALHERLTTQRFEKSLRVVVNSVIFRSSGQDLTTAGTYAEMTSRLTEPVLLGLAVLAVRGRVKR